MASAVVDGKIYTFGGDLEFIIAVTAGVRTVEVYDPINDSWAQKADMLTAREAASASAVNGIIYVMGGVAPGGVALDVVEAYDPATDTWTTKTPMPTARWALSTAVVDGKIYATGSGRGGKMVEEYDPATDAWTTKASMPVANGYFGTGVVDGIIYIMGGGSGPEMAISRVFAYDPSADKWSEKTAVMPTARFGLCAGVVEGKIYAIGGAPGWPPSVLSNVEEYDPSAGPTSVEALGWGVIKVLMR
jgi:N-acetylneuraminic acid mutarotase